METETWIDKSDWGEGPWQDEPDRAEWREGEYVCLALRNDRFGNWCGYVGLPAGHPWSGKGYDEVDVQVHGGLTFAASCMEDERPIRERVCHVPAEDEDDGARYWLGFDCGHWSDLMPGFVATERRLFGPDDPLAPLAARRHAYQAYKSLSYVQAEIGRLLETAREVFDDE